MNSTEIWMEERSEEEYDWCIADGPSLNKQETTVILWGHHWNDVTHLYQLAKIVLSSPAM